MPPIENSNFIPVYAAYKDVRDFYIAVFLCSRCEPVCGSGV